MEKLMKTPGEQLRFFKNKIKDLVSILKTWK